MIIRNTIAQVWSRLVAAAPRRLLGWVAPLMSWRQISPSPGSGALSREPLSSTDQWAKLSGVLTSAIARADDACRRQVAATQQLDLAQYALSTLADELSAVMSLPGRRERAPVYRFEVAAQRPSSQALAA